MMVSFDVTNGSVYINIHDHGMPYNPLDRCAPDITLGIEEREVGGMGVFMVTQIMDNISYCYQNRTNQIMMDKSW